MKLKEIPLNTVIHTPTEEEAKELLRFLHENGYIVTTTIREMKMVNSYKDEDICFFIDDENWGHCTREWYEKKGYTILTLAEFKEKYVDTCTNDCSSAVQVEKPRRKFKVGEKVMIDGVINLALNHHVGSILELPNIDHPSTYKVGVVDGYAFLEEVYLNPYTEPETTKEAKEPEKLSLSNQPPTEDIETKEKHNLSQDVVNCDKPEDKELNLCELLKGHEGEKFFSPISNNPLKLKAVFGRSLAFFLDEEDDLSIDFDGGGRITITSLNDVSQLKYITDPKSQCLLFPSRALYEQYPLDPYTAWMKWQEEQKKYTLAIAYNCPDKDNAESIKHLSFRSPSDRDKCLSEIEVIIEKYSKK